MTVMSDRANRGESRRGWSGGLVGRIAVWIAHGRLRGHHSRRTTIALSETPERALRDIGLLDGRQVIPLRREEGWRR